MTHNNVKAVTLLELIIVIIIAALLTMIALPSYQNFMQKREYQMVLRELRQSIQQSQSYARLYKTNIVICPSSNTTTCQSNQWNHGLILFQDYNKNRQVNADEKIFSTVALNLKYGELTWRGTLAIPSVTFNSIDGLPIGSNGSFYYCQNHSSENFRLILSKMGHTRLEFPSHC